MTATKKASFKGGFYFAINELIDELSKKALANFAGLCTALASCYTYAYVVFSHYASTYTCVLAVRMSSLTHRQTLDDSVPLPTNLIFNN